MQQKTYPNGEETSKQAEDREGAPAEMAPAVYPSVPSIFAIHEVSHHDVGSINHRANLHAILREMSELVSKNAFNLLCACCGEQSYAQNKVFPNGKEHRPESGVEVNTSVNFGREEHFVGHRALCSPGHMAYKFEQLWAITLFYLYSALFFHIKSGKDKLHQEESEHQAECYNAKVGAQKYQHDKSAVGAIEGTLQHIYSPKRCPFVANVEQSEA